jgi:16S rRNA (cytosine1402-N4)-methyltransferase
MNADDEAAGPHIAARKYTHLPVMPDRVLELLDPRPGETAVDGTVGLGGHSRLLGAALGETGRLVCFDRDPEALALAGASLSTLACGVCFVNTPYEFMAEELARLGMPGANRVFLDLGVSSLQLDKPERGFSFMRDGPLDMRMNQSEGESAADIVNSWPEAELARLFKTLGEERFPGRIAKSIAEKRSSGSISTTGELSALIAEAVPYRGKNNPATRVFQALRMQVNDELGTLSRGLAAAGKALAPGGRLAVLTFHSLEDRLVKKTFARWEEMGLAELVTRKAVSCGREEAVVNRRARSAKLRVTEKAAE